MIKDLTGDGMIGAVHYNRGHVKFKRSVLDTILTVVAYTGAVIVTGIVVGSLLNINMAQKALEYVVAGK